MTRLVKFLFKFSAKFLAFILLLSANLGLAQPSPNDVIAIDSVVRIGKLPNGLTYYIRTNKWPEKKVELRLVLNAGSINEDPDQLGLAHMCEHMAFNGTKNFRKNDIVSYLQDIGVGFGNDLNAYTSFDETVYILPIPTDKPGNLEKGFQILEDWAHQVSYLDEDIETERGVILEESRLGKGAQDRMFRKIYPRLFAGSKYADRLPIGSDSIIRTFKPDVIRRFYRDWYRPDLMAVIVVGDIEENKALDLIRKHFSALENPQEARTRRTEMIPSYSKPEAMVVTDKEATGFSVVVNYPIKNVTPIQTFGDYRKALVRQLYTSMLNQRLQELTQLPEPPFVGAGASFGGFVRDHENFRAFVSVGSGDVRKGLTALMNELERANRFGFTLSELERSKKSILNSLERNFNNRDKTESEDFADEYAGNFLTKEPIPGIAREFEYTRTVLPGITLEEVNEVSNEIRNEENRFVYATGPELGPGSQLVKNDELLATMKASKLAQLTPYQEKEVVSTLLAEPPKPGKIVSRSVDKAMGTTTVVLSNGVKVTLKSTDFKNDQVLLSATRPGGKNGYSLADKYNAEYAIPVVTSMGVGKFTPVELRKVLSGKSVSVSPSIGDITDGFRGNSGKKDIETLLQLVYLYVTSPRKDTGLFSSFIQRSKQQYAAIGANPQTAFVDTLFRVLYNDNPLAPIAVPKPSYFEQLNLDRCLAIYKEHIGDASGMHFVLVGSLQFDSIMPMLETYLGSLPVSKQKFMWKDNKVRPVTGKKMLTVNKGKEKKSLILGFFNGEVAYKEDLELKAAAISEILNIRIIEELREKIQGIYGGGMFSSVDRYPYGNYSFVLQLPCGPEKVDTLLAAARHEIDLLKVTGPGEEYLNKVKKQWLEKYRTGIKENQTWLNQITEQIAVGSSPARFLDYEKYVNALTVQDIKTAAQLFFNGKNEFIAVLMPEKE
ncbi:insulinase family protein [Flavihumibacter rivuli]|uniref:M16 family metallopeptidase n=1 Tax=Flavihumibacter rivuli TaxID=2838156 RepID=UPI001BDF2449|nr:M16 family metallopeptidase [Flavihumibacter rivuli]ULQ56743.1 insulinase family protein [Flavihumibacter rivuli]